MSAAQFQPKPEHKFTFGLWTVGNRGRDPFGDFVRPPISPVEIAAMLGEAHAIARARAIAETGLADEVFPEVCPITATDVMSRGFLPEQ